MSEDIVTVELPACASRSYPIHVGSGLTARIGDLLNPHLVRDRLAIITETRVEAAQGQRLKDALRDAGIHAQFLTLPPGESTKSFENLQKIISTLLDWGIERNDCVLAFGGGVIGDITGFACSTVRRGCRFIQMPTTLLAQVDSAVGGKTAINVNQGKNLVGAFYQPVAVISDIDMLETLPLRERRAGYAEIVKYGLLGDAEFFTWLEHHGRSVIDNQRTAVLHAVTHSCRMKAAIVRKDERETGERALLNLGHTFGHALEAAFGYSDALLHGEAVAIGMMMAFDFAVQQKLCSKVDSERLRAHLVATGCPQAVRDISAYCDQPTRLTPDQLITLMMQDKKVERGQLTLILPERIGQATIHRDINIEKVRSFWSQKLRE